MARELDRFLEQNEKLFWSAKPKFLPFILSRAFISIIISGFFLIPLALFLMVLKWKTKNPNEFDYFLRVSIPFLIFRVLFLIIPVLSRILKYRNTHYAVTNKRIILEEGIVGRDFQMINVNQQLTNLSVNVSLVDKLFGNNSGTLTFTTSGSEIYIFNIPKPYEVFNIVKNQWAQSSRGNA